MDIAERFWSFVPAYDACWEWSGTRIRAGYGYFWADGLNVRAHRFAWELTNGPIPEGMAVLHSCDNAACVRPSHLLLGSAKANITDKLRRGRMARPGPTERHRGEWNGNAKLTNEKVAAIRSRYTGAHGQKAALAREYGISKSHVARLLSGEAWLGWPPE